VSRCKLDDERGTLNQASCVGAYALSSAQEAVARAAFRVGSSARTNSSANS